MMLTPESIEGLFSEGNERLAARDYRQAELIFQRLVDNGQPEAWHNLALALRGQERHAEEIRAEEEAAAVGDPKGYVALAIEFWSSGDDTEAGEMLRRAGECEGIDPDTVDYVRALRAAFRWFELRDLADGEILRANQGFLYPVTEAYGDWLLASGRIEEGLRYLEALGNRGSGMAFYLAGDYCLSSGRLSAALRLFREGARLGNEASRDELARKGGWNTQ